MAVWFPSIAMILVGIPWAFWIMTGFYMHLTERGPEIGNLPKELRQSRRHQAVTPARPVLETMTHRSIPLAVRGMCILKQPPPQDHGGWQLEQEQVGQWWMVDGNADSELSTSPQNSNMQGSPLASHESEMPLALSKSW